MTSQPENPSQPLTGGFNTGHGHVRPRPDGVKARCGGPALCGTCALEARQAGMITVKTVLHPALSPSPATSVNFETTPIVPQLPAEERVLSRPILSLDFDGVLHSYVSGWQGAVVIPDPPVPGAIKFLADAQERFRVAIFSSRSHAMGGREAMMVWLAHCLERDPDGRRVSMAALEWPLNKPAAFVTLDDRAVTFTGTFPSVDELLAFQPWNKRERSAATVGSFADGYKEGRADLLHGIAHYHDWALKLVEAARKEAAR